MSQTRTHDLTFTETEVRKRFVSWREGEAEREWAMLNLLAEHAPGLAPAPVGRECDDHRPVIVMTRLRGKPLSDAPLTPKQTIELARTLRELWEVPIAAAQQRGIGERRYGPMALAALVSEWLNDTYDLSLCRDPGLVRRGMAAGLEWLTGDGLPEPVVTAVGIADLNPSNVLWDGSRCRLVDFEDGGLTEPAFEVADHVEHLGGRHLLDPDALVEAVGLTADERARARSYRLQWAAFWLAMLLPGNGGWHRNPLGTTEAQADRLLTMLA